MKIFNKILALAISSLLIFTGCDFKTSSEGLSSSGETMSVEGKKGKVDLKVEPKRIVVFDMGILDSIDVLDLKNIEVAVPVAGLTSYLSKYEKNVNVGDLKEPNFEKIYEFNPDLIIISGRQESFYDKFVEIAPTWYIKSDYPTVVSDFEANMKILGQMFKKDDKVNDILSDMNSKINNLSSKAEKMTEKASIILTNNGSISTYGSGSRFGIIHDYFKVPIADKNIEVSTHGQDINFEYISQINPDIIFIVDRTSVVAGDAKPTDTLNNDLVKGTNAYKNNKMVYLDPEVWYIAGIGLGSVFKMIDQIEVGIK